MFDTLIYNRSTNFRKSEEYDRLYNKLQCIEFDYFTNRCIIYELPCDKDKNFYLLGTDFRSGLTYIVTAHDKTVYKLDNQFENAIE
jgi:hypothetical protein